MQTKLKREIVEMASMKEVLANRVNPTTYETHKKKWELTCVTSKF
jgi:hypothetical protein